MGVLMEQDDQNYQNMLSGIFKTNPETEKPIEITEADQREIDRLDAVAKQEADEWNKLRAELVAEHGQNEGLKKFGEIFQQQADKKSQKSQIAIDLYTQHKPEISDVLFDYQQAEEAGDPDQMNTAKNDVLRALGQACQQNKQAQMLLAGFVWDNLKDQGGDLAMDIVTFVEARGGEISKYGNRFPPGPDYVELGEPVT